MQAAHSEARVPKSLPARVGAADAAVFGAAAALRARAVGARRADVLPAHARVHHQLATRQVAADLRQPPAPVVDYDGGRRREPRRENRAAEFVKRHRSRLSRFPDFQILLA